VRAIQASDHESTDHPIFGELLWQAAYDIVRTEEQLVTKAKSIADDMTRLAHNFETANERPYFSSLGELQSRGPELDRLCGVLDIAYETFDRLYAAWDYAVLHEPDRPGGEE